MSVTGAKSFTSRNGLVVKARCLGPSLGTTGCLHALVADED